MATKRKFKAGEWVHVKAPRRGDQVKPKNGVWQIATTKAKLSVRAFCTCCSGRRADTITVDSDWLTRCPAPKQPTLDSFVIGERSDGYPFLIRRSEDGFILLAGCRTLKTPAEARAHWKATRGRSALGKESFALIDKAEKEARKRGWLQKPARALRKAA